MLVLSECRIDGGRCAAAAVAVDPGLLERRQGDMHK